MNVNIIKEFPIGLNCSYYLIEVPPERRLVFFEPYNTNPYPLTALELPLPPMLYKVLGPTSKKNTFSTSYDHQPYYNIVAGAALAGPYSPTAQIYAVPFPNYYWASCSFSNCRGGVPVPDEMDSATAVEHIAECWFANPFRYMGQIPRDLWDWLGLPGLYAKLPDFYTKWEACSLEEAENFPWGKNPHEMTAQQLFG